MTQCEVEINNLLSHHPLQIGYFGAPIKGLNFTFSRTFPEEKSIVLEEISLDATIDTERLTAYPDIWQVEMTQRYPFEQNRPVKYLKKGSFSREQIIPDICHLMKSSNSVRLAIRLQYNTIGVQANYFPEMPDGFWLTNDWFHSSVKPMVVEATAVIPYQV